MLLFERLEIIGKKKCGSRAKLAEQLGIAQTTFNAYFSAQGQKRIRAELLEKIYTIFPEIDPVWLLTGRGEMESEGYTRVDGMLVGEANKANISLGPVAERVDGIERAAPGTPLVDMLPFVIKNLRSWYHTVSSAMPDNHAKEPDGPTYAQESADLKQPPGRVEDSLTKG